MAATEYHAGRCGRAEEERTGEAVPFQHQSAKDRWAPDDVISAYEKLITTGLFEDNSHDRH